MWTSLKKRYYRWLGKVKLIRRYEYLNEVNRILEEYITEKLVAGGSTEFISKARTDLISKQGEIKETDNMIGFLKRLKRIQ
jgi:hypothetical protein